MQLVLCAWVKLQEEDGDDDELRGLDLTKYRSVVARANFVAQDRPDIRYSVKELCRDMSRPVQSNTQRLKKLVRYLLAHPRVVWKIKLRHQGDEQDCVTVMVDSDWAGCSVTRKMWRGVCLKACSTTQGGQWRQRGLGLPVSLSRFGDPFAATRPRLCALRQQRV